MLLKHGIVAVTALCALLILGGCPREPQPAPAPDAAGQAPQTAPPEPKAPDAVPISVRVVEDPQKPSKLDVTVTMSVAVSANTELLVHFDVRNTAAGDPDRHVDPDLVLALNERVRKVTCLAGQQIVSFKIDLAETRSINAEVNIIVDVPVDTDTGTDYRGARGKAAVNATSPAPAPAVP